jgi:hypothetical protein
VRVDQIGPVVKGVSVWQGAGFGFPIRYTLADGREIESIEHRRLKRDAVAAHAAMPTHPTNVTAIFRDGQFVGTTTTYTYGALGLVADS